MFVEKEFSNLRILNIASKDIYIVDRHQYVLPIWAKKSLEDNLSYELVSIDYHPDTNPPFWQKSYLKAVNENRQEDNKYIDDISQSMVAKIERGDINAIINCSDNLNNDEHINTAIKLKFINDYHMINCMDNHKYDLGKHYLINSEHFSSISDTMFESLNFQVPKEKFILDIDLDYFLEISSFELNSSNNKEIFRKLVLDSSFITIARSIKYFNYLKRENFTIEECEELMIRMIYKILIGK